MIVLLYIYHKYLSISIYNITPNDIYYNPSHKIFVDNFSLNFRELRTGRRAPAAGSKIQNKSNSYFYGDFDYPATEDDMIIFPATLQHEVPVQKEIDELRICVVTNIKLLRI